MKIIRNLFLAFFVVACLAYVNVIIPKPQPIEARTFLDEHPGFNGAQMFACTYGTVKIGVYESPSCQSGVSDMNGYTAHVWIGMVNATRQYKLVGKWSSYYCENPNSPGCNQNEST